jgi:hypothetical protein
MGANAGYTPPVQQILGVSDSDITLIPAEIEDQSSKWQPIMNDLLALGSK